MTNTFTEAEEAFIAASIDVIKIGDEAQQLEAQYQEAQQRIPQIAEQLPLQGRDGLARTNVLTHEAASRAGFGPDSVVVQALDEAFEQITAYLDLIDQAAAEAVTADANPTI